MHTLEMRFGDNGGDNFDPAVPEVRGLNDFKSITYAHGEFWDAKEPG